MECCLAKKKESFWVSPNEVDEPRTYCTEWSKSERERQILHITCVWNTEKCYWWIYLQGSNGDHRDRDQICGHGGGIGEWDELRVAWKHIHYHM